MSDEFYVVASLGFGFIVNSVISLCTFVAYRKSKKLLEAIMTSLNDGIDDIKHVDTVNPHESRLKVIRGNVKSIGPPLKSLNKPSVSGVIQELIIREHRVEKMAPGYWSDRKKTLDEKWNVVPFEIRNKNYKVAVTSPLAASYLELDMIDDRFEPSISSLLSLLFGVHQKGFQYTEFLLRENAMVTAFGELIRDEKGGFQLIPPRNGMKYILSTMDPESLVLLVRWEKSWDKYMCIFCTSVSVVLLSVLVFVFWRKRRDRLKEENMKKELARQRARRNANSPSMNEDFACIVCLSQLREVVMLPCGHICLCYDCSVQLRGRPCPVCQQHVNDVCLVYIS